ncbi:MAG: peptide chain release factor N(5)-glutamine methyltransferase, partial [Sneathiella sp.]
VSHILGSREFWSRNFVVNAHVLDPRPDSETLIDAVLERVKKGAEFDRLLDLGTGSGCLLLTLLAELPEAEGVGVDQSEDALVVAKENALRLGLEARTDFLQSDWFSAVEGQYDLILSNPPYIETEDVPLLQPEVAQYEPHAALDGGPDGLICYRHIISELGHYLRSGGYTIFEVGQGQADIVANYLEDMNFIQIEIHNDLASIGRCVSGQLKK